MRTGTIRPRRLFLICVVAAWVGILLASGGRIGRETASPTADGPPAAGPPDEVVRAAPPAEPKPDDPVPIPPVVEQPKRDEPVSPRVEPRPDPPPEDPAPTRQAAYVKIVTALDGVELTAVKKFGRRPRPEDLAGFTIPYKAFVDDRKRQVRKQLAKELGLSESEIDQIKKDGDRAGWPKR